MTTNSEERMFREQQERLGLTYEQITELAHSRKKIIENAIGVEAAAIIFDTIDNQTLLHIRLREEFDALHEAHHKLCDAFEQLHNLTCPNCLNKEKYN